MTKPPFTTRAIDRRRFLGMSAGTAAAAFGVGSLGALLQTRPAYAADYKALVCVFLYGGNDGLNMVTPTDARYDQYAAVRAQVALPKASLVSLAGSAYGLHPSLAALQPFWNTQKLAPVFNVGPLVRPMDKAQFLAAADTNPALIPDNLFSHSDQQLLWESSQTESTARSGWGGRASEVLATANPVISLGGNGRFGVGTLKVPLVLPGPDSDFGAFTLQPQDLANLPFLNQRKAAIDALYAAGQDSDLGEAFATQQRTAFDISTRLGALVKRVPAGGNDPVDQAFAPITTGSALNTDLGAQLYQIAKLIAANATVQGNRQIFFAQMDGFDTHGDQVNADPTTGKHAELMKELGDALAAFHTAMNNLGMAAQVTSFTQSDFGRTFAPNNSSGTDHAWGNHQLVLGGAVAGGATYGTYPTLQILGPDDVGTQDWERQGRWIPTSSVDQYAATLLRWFGASEANLDAILPNLKNFTARTLNFL